MMPWDVRLHPDFVDEAEALPEQVTVSLTAMIRLLHDYGPSLKRPHCDTLKGSKHTNMNELRFNANNGAWRIAFAFDPRRQAILLVGGSKSGTSEKAFYKRLIRTADSRFDAWLED